MVGRMNSPRPHTFWCRFIKGHIDVHDYFVHIYNLAIDYRMLSIVPPGPETATARTARTHLATAVHNSYDDHRNRLITADQDKRANIMVTLNSPRTTTPSVKSTEAKRTRYQDGAQAPPKSVRYHGDLILMAGDEACSMGSEEGDEEGGIFSCSLRRPVKEVGENLFVGTRYICKFMPCTSGTLEPF